MVSRETGVVPAVLGLIAAALLAGCTKPAGSAAGNAQAIDHSAMGHGAPTSETDAARAYNESMARMHRDMGQASVDPDESFARMMLAHHEGAIEMARIELKYGRDPELRRLAEQVVASQEPEVRQLRRWLETHKR